MPSRLALCLNFGYPMNMSHRSRKSRVLPLAVGLSLLVIVLYHFPYSKDPFHITRPAETDLPLSDVELVVASMKHEDTAWLEKHFPHWRRSIYTVDERSAPLTVPKNKGRESMVYLTYDRPSNLPKTQLIHPRYMIDNYDNLPPYMLFIHAQRFQWHNDDPDYDGVPLLRSFQFPYLRDQGYVNLRCVWAVGCPSEIYPFVDEGDGTDEEDATARMVFRNAFQEILPEKEVPPVVSASCCAQFALTREMIRSRPREDYIEMRQWLLDTPLTDSLAGRVFEYSWHSESPGLHCVVESADGLLQLCLVSRASIAPVPESVTARSMVCATCNARRTTARGDISSHRSLPCQRAGPMLAGTGRQEISADRHNNRGG